MIQKGKLKQDIQFDGGMRFGLIEQTPLKDGSKVWAIYDAELEDFVRDENNPLTDSEKNNILLFYREQDAIELRNALQTKYLQIKYNKNTN